MRHPEREEFHLWEEETILVFSSGRWGVRRGEDTFSQPAIFPGVRTRAGAFSRVLRDSGALFSRRHVHEQQNFVFEAPASFRASKAKMTGGLLSSGGATSRQRDGFAGAVPAGA